MISKNKNVRLSKFLSLVLRHAPETIDLKLDKNGWANVEDLIRKMSKSGEDISFEILEYVVDTNAKKRFAFNDDKSMIRASQGHSLNVSLNYEPQNPPAKLFHGTCDRFLKSILENGIKKGDRQYVHLSSNIDTAIEVGKRHGKAVVLEIMANKMTSDGYEFYLSENNVWLTDFIPVEYFNVC